MSHNDNATAQMLLFPVQQATPEELDHCDDCDVLYFQARLAIIKVLNLVRAGKCPADDELRNDVLEFNDLCRATGYPPLRIDF